jgi:hypothetical protein
MSIQIMSAELRDWCLAFGSCAPNNSPEPPPIVLLDPHSRLTVGAARLSFGR